MFSFSVMYMPHDHFNQSSLTKRKIAQNKLNSFCIMRQNRHYLSYMSFMEVFGVSARVGVDVVKILGVGAKVFKPETGMESKSENVIPVICGSNPGYQHPWHICPTVPVSCNF